MSPTNQPSANPVPRGEKILHGLTWVFFLGGIIVAIVTAGVVLKDRATRPSNTASLVLLLGAFGFPAVHFAGYVWSRVLAGVAGLSHAALGALLAYGAADVLIAKRDGAMAGFFLLWAAFHVTLAVLMIAFRVRRGPQTPWQAAWAALADATRSETMRRRPTWHWRGYAIYSTFHNELADSTGKWQRWPVIRLLGWTAGWVSYLGIVVSAFGLSLMPTVLLGSWFRLGPPAVAYWVFATLAGLGSALLCFWAGRAVLRQWRQKIVDVESLALLAGAAFGLLGAMVYWPQGAARFFE
jgi:hypothetical protein